MRTCGRGERSRKGQPVGRARGSRGASLARRRPRWAGAAANLQGMHRAHLGNPPHSNPTTAAVGAVTVPALPLTPERADRDWLATDACTVWPGVKLSPSNCRNSCGSAKLVGLAGGASYMGKLRSCLKGGLAQRATPRQACCSLGSPSLPDPTCCSVIHPICKQHASRSTRHVGLCHSCHSCMPQLGQNTVQHKVGIHPPTWSSPASPGAPSSSQAPTCQACGVFKQRWVQQKPIVQEKSAYLRPGGEPGTTHVNGTCRPV